MSTPFFKNLQKNFHRLTIGGNPSKFPIRKAKPQTATANYSFITEYQYPMEKVKHEEKVEQIADSIAYQSPMEKVKPVYLTGSV